MAGALSPGKSTLTQRIARSGADAPRDERSNGPSRDERTHDREERNTSAWAEPDRWLADDRSPGDQQRVESDSVQTDDGSPALSATIGGATPVVDTGRSASSAGSVQRRAVPTAPTRLKDIVQLRRSGERAQAAPTHEPGRPRTIGRRLDLSVPVQQREASPHDPAPAPDALHESAAAGVATPAQPLPHRPELEAAFGRDLSFVRAHVGGGAEASARDIGAEAYARGDDVVLSAGSSKHTVAHEVAHVLQQRGGEVQLGGGVGAVGDRYERQADDIADAVVRGESVAHVLPGGDARGDQVQRAPAAALAHDDFERTMDNRVYQATRAGQQLAAPAYLHANMRDVRGDVGSFLLARPIGPGNPQLAFTDGRQAFLAELATPLHTDDESASIELLQRWIAPTDLNALVDRNRPILDDGATMETMLESKGMLARDRSQLRYDKGAKGPPHWSPTVGTALGSELETRLVESMARVAARLVALTDERRRAAAERDEAPADVRALEIPASHPLDRAVARGFLPEGRPATVEVTAGALKVEPGALLAYRKVKQVAWQDAAGGPWNAIRAIEPADANAEEMARHLWEDRAEAYRLRRVGALFFLAPDDAEAFPEAARHRPLSGAGSRIAAPVDDAYQQAIGPGAAEAAAAEASGLAPPAGIAPGSAALLAEWRLVHEQLTGLAVVTAPFGVAEPLLLADIQHSMRAVDLATLDPAQAAVRAAVFREQRSILGEVATEVGNLTMQFEAQRAQAAQAPDGARQAVSEGQIAVLRAFVRAGAMAHLAQTGRGALAEARQVQQTAVLGALEQMLSDAITRVEITRQLSGETVVYTKHSAQILGAGFAYRQAALRTRIADLRTQLRQGIVDGLAIQRLYGDVDALRFEASLVAHLGTIRQAVHAVEALEDSDWVAAAGQIDDLEDVRGVGRDLMHDIRAIHREWLRIQQRAAALQQEIEAAGGAPDADAQAAAFAQSELATVKARLDKLGGDQRVADYLRRAYDEIDDAQTKAAILQICVLIGVTLVAAATGGAAQGAVAGIIGEGGGAILAGMFVESATMSVLNAALTGDSFVEAMTSDMAGNLVTLGALKGLDSLLATTKVGKVLLAGADDAGRAAYYTAKGVELTGRMLVIAGCQYAQMQYESLLRQGRTLSMDEVRQEGVKGVAMMIGTGVLTRLAKTPLTKIKALGAHGGGLVKQHVELKRLASDVETSGDPAKALELLRAERAHLEAEAATWNDLAGKDPAELRRMGLEPDMVATFAANAQSHLAGVDVLASGALPAQLGLDPVVPGRVFAGDTIAVTGVLDSYRERGWDVATEQQGSGARHTLTSSDGQSLTILERGSHDQSSAQREGRPDQDNSSKTPSARSGFETDHSRDPFSPAEVARNRAAVEAGHLGYNAIVGHVGSEKAGIAVLQRLMQGDHSALAELGVTHADDFQSDAREWGLGQLWDGKYVIVAGESAAVDWSALDGVRPVAHSHLADRDRQVRQGGRSLDLHSLVAVGTDGLNMDTAMVFPSPEDIRFVVQRRLPNHFVAVPYEHVADHEIRLAESKSDRTLVFELADGKYHGVGTGTPPPQVYSAHATVRAGGATLWSGEVFAVLPPGGDSHLTFAAPPLGRGASAPLSTGPEGDRVLSGRLPDETPNPTAQPDARVADDAPAPPRDEHPERQATPKVEQDPLIASYGQDAVSWAAATLSPSDTGRLLTALSAASISALRDVSGSESLRLVDVYGPATLDAAAPALGGRRLLLEVELVGAETARAMVEQAVTKRKLDKIERHADNLAAVRGDLDAAPDLDSQSVIVDSQMMIPVRKLVDGKPWSELSMLEQAMVNRLRDRAGLPALTADPPERVAASIIGQQDLRAGNVGQGEIGPGSAAGGVALTVDRSDPIYVDMLSELAKPPAIGRQGGAADRAVVADAVFAKTDGSTIPTLMTADKAIFARLAERYAPGRFTQQIVAGEPESLPTTILREAPGGFLVRIPDRNGTQRPLMIVPVG